MSFLVTGAEPLSPFATPEEVEATKDIGVNDISPLKPLVNAEKLHVYRHEDSFPLKSLNYSRPFAHIGVDLLNSFEPNFDDDAYKGRTLSCAFALALGEARLRFGNDVSGVLPEPVTVQYIASCGQLFTFCGFQLNTLDLDNPAGVKNVVWMSKESAKLFEVCAFVKALPTMEGYNPEVFRTLAAMYLHK